jgi:UDPglucose--hexose-1-phosphate uridylyltransferase
VRLRRERLTSEFLDPKRSFERRRVPLEIRWDPLTGASCRLLPAGSLPPPSPQDVEALAAASRPNCPFCAESVESVTPMFPRALWAEGRIRHGEALLFPNLVPYAKWSSVSVYSPERHHLGLEELTASLLADNLTTQVLFARAVIRRDPASSWIGINANHLPPSGSSIFHPHLQGSASPAPTTVQRLVADCSREEVVSYVDHERRVGERWLGSSGGVDWLASFAPVGPGEIRGAVADAASPEDLDEPAVADLAEGLSRVLRLYAALGFQSFNLAVIGRPRPPLLVRSVARTYFGPLLRSDAMWSERLLWEAATDLAPETLAEQGRHFFEPSAQR